MKILIDMNLSPRWADFLSSHGFPALHWSSVGPLNASDKEIMCWAKNNDYIVMTHDLDFSAILSATQGSKPSVVQIRGDDVHPDIIGQKIVFGLRQSAPELEAGALLSIDTNRIRLRILPLQRP